MADLADHANELVLARLDGLLAAPGCSRCIDCQDRHERR